MDNIFFSLRNKDDNLIDTKRLGDIINYIDDKDIDFLDKICHNAIKVCNNFDIIDFLDIDYIKVELNKIKNQKLKEKYYSLILINYSFDLTFNLYDNKTISKLFSLDINIDKNLFEKVNFKYKDKDLKLQHKLIFSLQKNLNYDLLLFLEKHFKSDLSFDYFTINPKFLYDSIKHKDFIIKAKEIGLFDFDKLNIKTNNFECICSALDYLGRERVFHEKDLNKIEKDCFLFFYSLGIKYDFDKLNQYFKNLILEIKETSKINKMSCNKLNKIFNKKYISKDTDIKSQINLFLDYLENNKKDVLNILKDIKFLEIEEKRNKV